MYLLNNYSKQIGDFIASESKRSRVCALAAIIVLLSTIAAVILHYGAPVMNGRPWDVPALLDGGWRIVNGQIPYRDFFVHHGPLSFFVTALGMKLAAPCVGSIDYGAVAFMTVVCLCAIVVLSRRTSAFYSAVFTLLIGLLIVAPRPLGDPYDFTDHALIFTRFGEALLMLLCAILFVPPLKPASNFWKSSAEMALAGLLMCLLVFNKVNYGLLGIGFCVAAVIFRSIPVKNGLIAIVSATLIALAVDKVTGISFTAMLRAYTRVAVGFQGDFRIKIIIIQALKCLLVVPLLLVLIWESAFGKYTDGRLKSLRHWAVPSVLFAGAVLLLASNTQTSEAPLLGFAAFYSAEMIRRDTRNSTNTFFTTSRNVVSLCIVLFFVAPTLFTDLLAVRHTAWLTHRKDFVTAPTLASTALNDLRFAPEATRWLYSKDYMESVAEGVELLRRHTAPDVRVMPLVFTNPFQMGLGLKPIKGGIVFWDPVLFQFHNSFPPLSTLIGDANALLISADDHSLEQAYKDQWTNLHLQTIEHTKHYILYKIPSRLSVHSQT